MYIKELELSNFRNYEELKVSFSEGVNIFLGENAQGKTNLLEGIYLHAMARSFKTQRDRDLIRFGQDYCQVKAVSHYEEEEHTSEIIISREGAKAVRVDGAKIERTSELLDRLHIIIFSPEDLKIVKDEPGKRRAFMDREICQLRPMYVSLLNDYRRILKQRNAYLRENIMDEVVLSVWDSELIRLGARLSRERRRFIEKIDKIANEIHHRISGGRENLTLSYETDLDTEAYNAKAGQSLQVNNEEECFAQLLTESNEKDRLYGTTRKGPHHDDIKISADGIDLRRFGSQGQQRTAALSLKLSEIKLIEEETGDSPILLLDDVLSELDSDRQKYLINSLGDNQMFITTTDLIGSVARELPEGKIFTIKNGEIDIEI